MKKINSSLIYSIIKSNILISKKTNVIFSYTKVINEIKQFLYLINYCIKNQIKIYIICDSKQYKFLFDSFLDSDLISTITSQTALKISKKSFFIFIGNILSCKIYNKLIEKNNIVCFVNDKLSIVDTYKLTIHIDSFTKVLFIISLLKNK